MGRAAPLAEPSALVGISLSGGYRLVRLLHAGGHGVVFEATDASRRRVALKILRPDVITEDALTRLSREASVTSKIDNRHIVPILDAGHDLERDLAYLVMPLLEGSDVAALLAETGPLAPEVAVRIALQAAAGLSAGHTAGIVYRDVRPSRIFLEKLPGGDVAVRVFGFGVPKAGGPAGAAASKSQSASDEKRSGSQDDFGDGADLRDDVFGLGATLYEMLGGVPPWADYDVTPDTENVGPDAADAQRRSGEAGRDSALGGRAAPRFPSIQDRAPWVPARVANAVASAIQADVDRRYPSMDAFAEALHSINGEDARLTADMLHPVSPDERAVVAERAESESDPMIGHVLGGRYAVRRLIGRGGMGAVYEAEGPEGRRVAAKVIFRSAFGQDDQALRRFIREARAVTAIQSPHVVKTFELGTDITLGSPFIVMELLYGIDLAKLLRQRGPMEPGPLVRVFLQAARGLAAAHREGIVHRDIKPANLFLHVPIIDRGPPSKPGTVPPPSQDRRITVKVCDFGIAKRAGDGVSHELTQAGGVLGSPIYMSPEQAKMAKDVDRRSDVWSLCVSLYQALCGSCPWDPNVSLAELLMAICSDRVPPLGEAAPWVDPGLAAVVHRGLMRDAADRWQNMDDLIAALVPFAGEGEVVTLDQLRGVDPERRARATPMSKLRGASKAASTAEGQARSIDGGADPPSGVAGRRRTVQIAATFAILLLAGAIVLRGARNEAPAPPAAPDTVAAIQPPAAPAGPESISTALLVPGDAAARVNGEPREIVDGRLALTGKVGDVFEVEISRDGVRKIERVFMTRDGKIAPDHIELPAATQAATGGRRGGRPPSAGGGPRVAPAPATQTAAPAASPPPNAVKPVDTW